MGQTWEYSVDPVPGTIVSHFDRANEPVARENAPADERLLNRRAAEGWELTRLAQTITTSDAPDSNAGWWQSLRS